MLMLKNAKTGKKIKQNKQKHHGLVSGHFQTLYRSPPPAVACVSPKILKIIALPQNFRAIGPKLWKLWRGAQCAPPPSWTTEGSK